MINYLFTPKKASFIFIGILIGIFITYILFRIAIKHLVKKKLYKNLYKKKCNHKFIRISNCWFHWNYGYSMCVGKCIKCNLRKNVKTSETTI